MADVTASMVKELRANTGVGMMDAKKALVANDGDMEKSVDWLRTQGLSKAEKKAGRTAAEGLVGVVTEGTTGSVVEINSETDFVSRNEEFQGFVREIVNVAKTVDSVEALAAADLGGKSVEDVITSKIATIGEHMSLRRMTTLKVPEGAVVGYVHSALADGLGKIGVLVALESSASDDALQVIGKQVAMHIAASNPRFLGKGDVDADVLERERTVLKEQAIASGKPPEIAEKMVDGRIRKFYEEICLTEQTFIMDTDKTVAEAVAAAGKDAGAEIKLVAFARVQLGEGIEKKEEDFAAEVAAVANG
ncbi:MAG: elongation factor Ts [Alphaproteobacteria bacterium]|nr:MAG: elongation factor Ts [Alphaproteobacteria bacterium]